MAVEEAKLNTGWRREYIIARQNEMDWLSEGREQGLEQGARAVIETVREFGGSFEDAVKSVESKMGISPEKSREYADKYW